MASGGINRGGVVHPPSLPTIKETTLSWLGSELESSIFSSHGAQTDNDPSAKLLLSKNIQRYIDFDDQCLSLKSEEESEFSGIQPLPVGSDDTPPMAVNEFNRVVRMDYGNLAKSENRPKPIIESDNEEQSPESKPHPDTKPTVPSDFQALFGMLDAKMKENGINPGSQNSGADDDNAAMEKIQLIRLWQLMQQEDLRRRQEAEIAVLNAQRERMEIDRNESRKVISGSGNNSPADVNLESDDLASLNLDSASCIDNEVVEYNNSINQKDFDDIPVEKDKKSFEQLLEDELKKEQKHVSNVQPKTKAPIKRPFLRKGEGLARFKGPPIRKPPKQKSQNHIKKPNVQKLNHQSVGHNKKDAVYHKPPAGASKVSTQEKEQPVQNLMQRIKFPKNKLQLKKPEVKCRVITRNDEYFLQDVEEQPAYFRPAEDADLEEFEMLERYAEDDASFFNEPSLVASVLNHVEDSKDEKQMSLRDRVRERRRIREEGRVKTSIQSSPRRSPLQKVEEDVDFHEEDNEEEALSPLPPKPYFKSPERQNKVIQRKTASLVKKEKLVRPLAQPLSNSPITNLPSEMNTRQTALLSSPNSAFSPRANIARANDHTLATNENFHSDHCVDDFADDQTWADIDVSIINVKSQCTSVNEANSETDSSKEYKCSDYMVPENEDAENPVRDTNPTPLASARGLSLSPPPPPTSLMQKLFPSLKVPKPKLSAQNSVHKDESNMKPVEEPEDPRDFQTNLLKQKLEELEKEISRFKKENNELEKLRSKHEVDAKTFAKEVEEFRKQKDEELQRLEEFKKIETKKLKKERKLFEEHVQAMKMVPNKEEREEIQNLKGQIEKLNSEYRIKEQKLTSANARLRDQVSSLQKENKDLEDRIKELDTQQRKDRKLLKSKTKKQPSVWETVNGLVDAVDEEARDFPKGHSFASSVNFPNGNKNGKHKKTDLKKTVNLSPDVAISNLKDTLERTKPMPAPTETFHQDGKVEKVLKDGRRIVVFPNGTQKEISSDGNVVKVRFANGDIKQMYGDGSIVYYYDENGTTHTTHPDGLQVFEFPNKQVEHHFTDGTKQITFPDQTVKYLHIDGTEQTMFPDGTEMHIAANKDKTIVFANGQREVHTNSFKRREYPDGTSKTVFEDGRQETRYASGRLRIKDAHGNVIVDRMTT